MTAPAPIDTQPGPQTKAAESDADILVYGGAAGGGKSWLAIYDLAKYHHVPGYGGILFRRTSPELTGSDSVWSLSEKLYPLLGGEGRQHPVLDWRFPGGALVEMRHLQHEKDVRAHQSKAYARIVFDEATHFTSEQFWFLFSRMRTTAKVRKRFLLTCNPDPDSFILLELIDWWIGKDGFPIPERDGVKRWFVRTNGGEMRWADTREALLNVGDPVSVTFIASKLTDNKKLMEADPSYQRNLRALTPVLRARMEGGNWRIREGAGDMFQRGWAATIPDTMLGRIASGHPRVLDFTVRCRWWDRAATPVHGNLVPGIPRPADFRARRGGEAGKANWTRGLLGGLTRGTPQDPMGKIVLQNIVGYRDVPGAIEEAIIKQALEDGPSVLVGLWVDPAQAGIDQAQRMKRLLNAHGIGVILGPQVKTKREYATLPSQLMYGGGILVLSSDTGEEWFGFWNELEAFPPPLGMPESQKPMDDQVDVLSGLTQYLHARRKEPWTDYPDKRVNMSVDARFFGDPDAPQDDDEDEGSISSIERGRVL